MDSGGAISTRQFPGSACASEPPALPVRTTNSQALSPCGSPSSCGLGPVSQAPQAMPILVRGSAFERCYSKPQGVVGTPLASIFKLLNEGQWTVFKENLMWDSHM